MVTTEVQRTLVKSPPELWTELSDPEALARHLGALGEIRVTRVEPEQLVAWESDGASGTVALKASGWGTRVTFTVEHEVDAPVSGAGPDAEDPSAPAAAGAEIAGEEVLHATEPVTESGGEVEEAPEPVADPIVADAPRADAPVSDPPVADASRADPPVSDPPVADAPGGSETESAPGEPVTAAARALAASPNDLAPPEELSTTVSVPLDTAADDPGPDPREEAETQPAPEPEKVPRRGFFARLFGRFSAPATEPATLVEPPPAVGEREAEDGPAAEEWWGRFDPQDLDEPAAGDADGSAATAPDADASAIVGNEADPPEVADDEPTEPVLEPADETRAPAAIDAPARERITGPVLIEPAAAAETEEAAEPETTAPPPLEAGPEDAPRPADGPDLSAELRSAEEAADAEVTALLTSVLDRLGAAHHRPFSRS